MNIFFCPLLENSCPLFKHITQQGSHFAQTVVNFATFKFKPGKGFFFRVVFELFLVLSDLHVHERGA